MKSSRRIAIPLAALPALLVTGAALLVLLAGVAGAAAGSQPGDPLYALRRPALEIQHVLTTDPLQRAEIERRLTQPPAGPAVIATAETEPTETAAPRPTEFEPTETPVAEPTEFEPTETPEVEPTVFEPTGTPEPTGTVEPEETETLEPTETVEPKR
jgi:hypothetical protein